MPRAVKYVDDRGRERCRVIRDNDPNEFAEAGTPLEPPEVDNIDWEEVKRRLHNELIRRGLLCTADLGFKPGFLEGAVMTALKNEVIKLYRGTDREIRTREG